MFISNCFMPSYQSIYGDKLFLWTYSGLKRSFEYRSNIPNVAYESGIASTVLSRGMVFCQTVTELLSSNLIYTPALVPFQAPPQNLL